MDCTINTNIPTPLHIHELGCQPYDKIYDLMQKFTTERQQNTVDELWILEHFPVLTQGVSGQPEHILQQSNIPIMQTDRGGQITYHGPGQLVSYCLLNLKKRNLNIRTLVCKLEQAIINLLSELQIESCRRENAPGVYVKDKKIASLGLRVKNGCTYHGIALNVKMDLSPFNSIRPCGIDKLQMTQIIDELPKNSKFYNNLNLQIVSSLWIKKFLEQIN